MTLTMVLATLAIPTSLAAQSNQTIHTGPQPLTLTFRTVDIPRYESTQIYAVNNKNDVAGIYFDSTGLQHGMSIQHNTLRTIDDPHAAPGTTFCFSINNNDVVAGYYTNVGGFEVGFYFDGTNYFDVRPFPSQYVQIYGINDSGVMTGSYYDSSAGAWNAFYGSGSTFTSFTVPGGGYYVYGSAINNAGLIAVGYFVDPNNRVYMADLYNPTTEIFTPINVPGAAQTYVNGINDKTQLVFTWAEASGIKHGAVSANGKFLTFDVPDATSTSGDGINDNDIIVGTFLPTGNTQLQSYVAFRQPQLK
jgi:uncharacterized membrane protein